jgi:outer membrane protein assembly factor BamD (BamD/ComL family)
LTTPAFPPRLPAGQQPAGRPDHRLPAAVAAVVAVLASGCATFQVPTWPWAKTDPAVAAKEAEVNRELGEDADSEVISSEYAGMNPDLVFDPLKGENLTKGWKKLVGRGPNEQVAKAAMAEADRLFRGGDYKGAIPKYKKVIDRWPDSTLEEDARWQLAECLFFTDQYPRAEDAYDELVKKYANTKYLNRIAQRQFVIAQYWIGLDEKNHYPTIVPNLFDRSRPLFDTRGRALKAFDHVRINDPRGPLADDSLMAQANAHFLDHEWLDADYFYGLLRSEYPDSDFLLQAHLLGLQAKLQAYQGPYYEGGILDEAEILADQVVVQFPDQMSGEEESRIRKVRAEVAAQQAERHWKRAQFYTKGKYYTAARMYYAMIARDYPETQLAAAAREKYAAIETLADVSDDPFPMLTRVLNPDALKEAELDAMAEAEEQTAIARQPTDGTTPPKF